MHWAKLLSDNRVTRAEPLEAVDRTFATVSAYFDGCRIKRNRCEYDYAGGVTDTDADGLLETVQQFAIESEAWLRSHHPKLA